MTDSTLVTRLIGKRHYCEAVGKAPATIRSHAITWGMPCGKSKVDPFEMCAWTHQWFAANHRLLRQLKAHEGQESKAEADRRKSVADADMRELLLARERNETMPRADHDADRKMLMEWMASVFDRMPAELASRLSAMPPHEIRDEVEKYVDGIREEITKCPKQ